jgi:hypothetical protein
LPRSMAATRTARGGGDMIALSQRPAAPSSGALTEALR